jgi:hypothetical protein
MAVVLAEAAAGATALLFLGPLWGTVRVGFFKLTGSVILVLAIAAWLTARAGVVPAVDAGRWSVALAAAGAGVTALWLSALFARRATVARVIGLLSAPLTIATLISLSFTSRQSWPIALLQLLAGAAFLGAVIDGLLLGHWYLTDRGLTREPINWYTDALIVAVILEAGAIVLGGFEAVGSSREFNPLLTAGALAPWIALGMVGATALIAVLVRLTLRGARSSAVQAATGFFYLAVVTAFTAEVAARIRFLPA